MRQFHPWEGGEGKLPNVPDNEAHYYMGLAYKQLGETEKAEEYFRLAASGLQEPGSVLYYNDQPSDFIYYQGLANLELGLGENEKARELIQEILTKQSDYQGALGR